MRATSSPQVSEERRLLELIKKRRNEERAELLHSLYGVKPVIHHCDECRKEIYQGFPVINGRCSRCAQTILDRDNQLLRLELTLNKLRDEALTADDLLANSLFGKHAPSESDDPQLVRPELFCHIRKCSNKYSFHEMLVCWVCGTAYHAYCADLKYHLIRDKWQCTLDKRCTVCSNARCESSLLLCDGCDRAFHRWCVGLKEVPSGDWYCPGCSICSVCKRSMTIEDIKSALTFRGNARICSGCLPSQPREPCKLCYVCGEIKESWNCLAKCDGCEQEVHRECCRPSPCFPVWCFECLGVGDTEIDAAANNEENNSCEHIEVNHHKEQSDVATVEEKGYACGESEHVFMEQRR